MAAVQHHNSQRRKLIGRRRRVEDEGEDEAGPNTLEVDDDSLTEGSVGSDDHDPADDSDTSNIDEASPTSPNLKRITSKGAAKTAAATKRPETVIPIQATSADTEIMLHGLSISDKDAPIQEISFDDVQDAQAARQSATKSAAPIIVSSASASQSQTQSETQQPPFERRRREHEEYRKKRDEDPAFVPNRGAFFMHDHRHAGPAGNGFRPFPRGGGARGRGRGGFGGGLFVPVQYVKPDCVCVPICCQRILTNRRQQFQNPSDPLISSPWSHDMHEAVASPSPTRSARFIPQNQHHHHHHYEGPANGTGVIPTCPPSSTPINRTMSTEKSIAKVQVRVFYPPLEKPVVAGLVTMKQYTKLPDHRPPLRRDKPVRISLPGTNPRYIFPAIDRSFIFIPRAQRPNQQKLRAKGPRSGFGSIGGWSRRTSVFGGSYYNGSNYSPSIAMSRRSSLAPDLGREFLISPTGSAISRPPIAVDNSRPVVRLPPQAQGQQLQQVVPMPVSGVEFGSMESSSINDLPQPQTHPLPQKPPFQENRPISIPMHQPRPQKTVSVENIESPVQAQQYQQQAFHQQYPIQVGNGYGPETHARHPSYPSQVSTGTPLSQIPERAIHAAPFQPNGYPQSQQGFYGQPYPMMPPQQQQGYYYPTAYPGVAQPNASAPSFVPGPQQSPQPNYAQQTPDQANAQPDGTGSNLVAQEVNGMVYYYDAAQLPAVPSYTAYPAAPAYVPGVMNMNGMVTSSQDGYYYPPSNAPAGMVYYP